MMPMIADRTAAHKATAVPDESTTFLADRFAATPIE